MLQPSQNKSKLLYDSVSKDYDIGTYEEFSAKLQNPKKRKSFYEGVGKEYSLGTYEEFESKISQSKKKVSSESPKQQAQKAATTESPSADGSLDTPTTKETGQVEYWKDPNWNKGAFNKTINYLTGLQSEGAKTVLTFADDIVNSAKNSLRGEGFFDDDIPDTENPITDAVKNKISTIQNIPSSIAKPQSDGGPLDPTMALKTVAAIGSKIINSTLSQDQKNIIISSLNLTSANLKRSIRGIDKLQEEALPKDNIPTNVVKGIVGMAPDLLAAAIMENPQMAEGKFAKWGSEVSKDAKPLLKKYVPKATKFIEEAVRAPFTKIMGVKAAAAGVANAKEGENLVDKAIEEGAKGAAEGMYMHALGTVAGKAMPVIAKGISKAGANSTIATAIANPLANAGVFTTARALRTGIEEQRLISGEEAIMEAGTGVGFSLLHAGSLYKNHKELNHYYDNTLKNDPLASLGRVVNETKDNLDLVYNPDLSENQVKELEDARDEIKKAIIKEPDLNNKKLLGDEALKIQNQLDAHSAINDIVENKESLLDQINSNEDLDNAQKEFYTKKIAAIADHFDSSEFSLKKKELNARIEEAQKNLDDAALAFTNLNKPSDRIQAKIDLDRKRLELDGLNNELTNLITEQDAIQKPAADESVLRTEQPELGLQEMGQGDAQGETITPTQPQEITPTPDEISQPIELSIPSATATQPEEVKGTFLDNILNKIYEYSDPITGDKLKGNVFFDGQEVVFTDGDKEFSLGTVQDALSNNSLNATEVTPTFNISEDGTIDILQETEGIPKGKITPQGTGLKAIKTDKNGNVKRVVITDANGATHSVKGELANELADFMMLDLAKKGGLIRKINSDETTRETFNRGVREASAKRKSKNTQTGVQRLDGGRRVEEAPTPQEIEVVTEPTPVVETILEEAPVAKPVQTKAEQTISQIDKAIKALFDRNGSDTDSWVNGSDNRDLIALKRAKKALQLDAKTFKTFLDTTMGKRYSEMAAKFEAPEKEAPKAKKPSSEVKDLLNLDTKDKTSLEKVSDYLEKLDRSLDINPNELNDVTRVMAIGTAKAVIKTLKALVKVGKTLQEAINIASERHSVAPEDVLKAFDVVEQSLKQKYAPSPLKSDIYFGEGRIISMVKDIKKITMTEKAALVKQIKDLARGGKDAQKAIREATQSLIEEVKSLREGGKINKVQEQAVINKLGKTNVLSDISVSKFIDYVSKVYADADYSEKLSQAKKTTKSIKELSKNEKKNPDLRALGSEFAKIDPLMVENIEEYNDLALKVKNAIEGSKIRKSDTKFAETVNIEDVSKYVEKTLEEQDKKIREEKIAEIQDLLGVDASEFSADEIDALLASDKELSKDDEKIVRATVKKAFDTYSTMIKEMVKTGKDLFTGEDVSFNKNQKELIGRFMNIDPNKIKDPKDALATVDSLINFIQNKSTAGMLKPINDYEGIIGSESLVKKGFVSKALRKFWSPGLGKTLGEQTTTLPVLFEKMFKGFNAASEVEDAMGFTELVNGKSYGQQEGNLIVKDYVKKFFDKKANGEKYNSAYNDIERGVLAHVMRNVIGTEAQMKKEFDTRKEEAKQTADFLMSRGNEQEREVGELVKKAYDKLLSDSETIQDVKRKAAIENLNGVEHWIKEWDKKYESLSDLATNFYNKILGKDLNFTPDRIIGLKGETGEIDLENNESAFIKNTDGVLYNKKSGSLMDKSKDRKVPKDMYIDLSFDKKNSNAMYDALIDLNTASHIRKVQSFLNSDNFRKVFREDGDLIKKRIAGYIRNSRNKNPYSGSELTGLIRTLDKVATIGVAQALASPIQPLKQTVPVALSTLINSGSLGMGASFNPKFNGWLDGLGYGISNRGLESRAEIESINKLLEKAADSNKEKAIELVRKANDKMLKMTLVNPDVWIARASFKAYYEQSLKQQGEKSSNIDYSSHEVNRKAANYAQRMVDRQQNISDHDLAGDLFTSKESVTKATVKMLMAFSSFRMNQSSRLGADLTTLEYWNTSTKEDKQIALRSLAGYTVESLAYRTLSVGYGIALYYAAKFLMGKDDNEEEDKKATDNLIKAHATGAFTDTFSTLPLLDPYVQDAGAWTVDTVQDVINIPEEDKVNLFKANKQEAIKMLGIYGIVPQKAGQIYDLVKLSYGKKYTDNYGNEKEISQKNADALKFFIGPLIFATSTGIASPDVSSVINKAIKMSEKEGSKEVVLSDEPTKKQVEVDEDKEIEKAMKKMDEELRKD